MNVILPKKKKKIWENETVSYSKNFIFKISFLKFHFYLHNDKIYDTFMTGCSISMIIKVLPKLFS